MTPGFSAFGPDHIAVLAGTLFLIAVIIISSPWIRELRDDRVFRGFLAGLIVANEIMSWTYHASRGEWGIPLQLCDIEMFLMAYALLGKSLRVKQLAFLWGLAGSSQAIITPDLYAPFPTYPWIQFFLGHVGIVIAAVYLAAREDLYFKICSSIQAWIVINIYVVAAGLINFFLGTNLGYLARKPEHESLISLLGPWPYYIISLDIIAAVLFWACFKFGAFINSHAQGAPNKKISK
jgi:hypothetical integral membrane protein (TIGR02206 family)